MIAAIIALLLFTSPVQADSMINRINSVRVSNHLSPLVENSILDKTAQIKACDMNKKGYWRHEQVGYNFWDLMWKYGYNFDLGGENLARYCSSEAHCFSMWMNSKTHRANILEAEFTDIGIGRCGTYIVTHFADKL